MPAKTKTVRPKPDHPTYRITDHDDLELLKVIETVSRDQGATANEIGAALGITVNGANGDKRSPGQLIAPRLGAMRTVGLLERRTEKKTDEDGAPFVANIWFLSNDGKLILAGRLNKSMDTALGRLDAGSQLLVMQRALRSGYGEGSRTTALVLKRATQHAFAQRKVAFRQT